MEKARMREEEQRFDPKVGKECPPGAREERRSVEGTGRLTTQRMPTMRQK